MPGGAAADDGRPGGSLRGNGRIETGRRHPKPFSAATSLVARICTESFIKIPGTLGLTAVGADGAGDEGQRIFLGNEGERLGVAALAAQLDILGNVLADGTAALAGGGEAIQQGDLFIELPPGQRLDGLDVIAVRAGGEGQRLNGVYVHAGKGLEVQGIQLVADLLEALVAAGLEFCGGHGDGPNAALEQLVNVEEIGAAGIREAELSVKFSGDAAAMAVVRGKRAFPAMYISSLGSSPAFTSTGKVLESLRPNSRPCCLARASSRRNMGMASAY